MDIISSIEGILSKPNFSGSELQALLDRLDLPTSIESDSSILSTNGKNILYLFRKASIEVLVMR